MTIARAVRTPNAAALAITAVALVAKLPTLDQPLTENFAWRQTQTAWTALIFHQEGIDLLHPQVPVHGPPWVFGFEFPLFQAMGALLMDAGLPPDVAMRVLGLATFLVTGWLLYLLALQLAGAAAGLASLTGFLFSPFGLLWGRTSLIEFLATAFAVGFVLAATSWLEGRGALSYGLALIAGIGAMLVKITTGFFYLLPLFLYRPNGRRLDFRDWPLAPLIAVPALVGLLWVRHMDAVKAASPATAFQTSGAMVNFNFGTPEMRWSPEVWAPFALTLLVAMTGTGLAIWIATAAAKARHLPQGRFVAALLAVVILGPPIVLTPLYSTQDYYPAAISPAVALLVGLGAAWAWERRRRLIARAALWAGAALWVLTLVVAREYWMASYQPVVDRDGALAAAAFVRERTDPGDWVVIGGRLWDPTVLYYAGRRGYALDYRRGNERELADLLQDGRYDLFVRCPYQGGCEVIAANSR